MTTKDSDPTLPGVTEPSFLTPSEPGSLAAGSDRAASTPKAGSGEHPAVKALHGALEEYARESEEQSKAVRERVTKRLRSGSNRPHGS